MVNLNLLLLSGTENLIAFTQVKHRVADAVAASTCLLESNKHFDPRIRRTTTIPLAVTKDSLRSVSLYIDSNGVRLGTRGDTAIIFVEGIMLLVVICKTMLQLGLFKIW